MKRSNLKFLTLIVAVAAFAGGYVFNMMSNHGAATTGIVAADTADVAAHNSTISLNTNASNVDAAIQGAYGVAGRSVVFVSNPGVGTGSGVVFDSHGDIVTNNHVISGGKSFKVTFVDGKTVDATLVGADASDDLAVIHVNSPGLTLYPAHFAAASDIHLAEMVLAIGSPLGLKNTVTSGLISGLDRTQQEPSGAYIPNSIQTSAPINPGNSGGALVDLEGRVVGIPTMVQTTTSGNEAVQNVGFAIPSSRVELIAPQLIATGSVTHTGRAFLGISVGDATAQQSNGFGFGFGQTSPSATVSGAQINQIESSGPAGKAGLEQSDVITKLGATPVAGSDDLLAALADRQPNTVVQITYLRDGNSHTASVKLGELPATK